VRLYNQVDNLVPFGDGDIYVMNSDGSEQTRLNSRDGPVGYPSWSPDGSMIAFSSWYTVFGQRGHYSISLMTADGEYVSVGISSSGEEWVNTLAPTWSPDGSQIAYSSNRTGNYDIYTITTACAIDPACSTIEESTRLTFDHTADSYPSWSPDGSKIIFDSSRDGNLDIYVMNADGSEQTRLTSNDSADYYPSWSPDGSKIIFDSSRDGNLDIYVMNADGSEQTRLTSDDSADYYPSWSPDGSYISFSSYRDNNYNIYVMNADGSEQTRLTESEQFDYGTSWAVVSESVTPPVLPTATPLPPSHTFSGTASLNGTAVADETVITALIEDERWSTTSSEGEYRLNIIDGYDNRSLTGKTVSFTISGSNAAETATFEPDGSDVLNLSATTTPAPGSDRVIYLNEEVAGEISAAGQFEP